MSPKLVHFHLYDLLKTALAHSDDLDAVEISNLDITDWMTPNSFCVTVNSAHRVNGAPFPEGITEGERLVCVLFEEWKRGIKPGQIIVCLMELNVFKSKRARKSSKVYRIAFKQWH